MEEKNGGGPVLEWRDIGISCLDQQQQQQHLAHCCSFLTSSDNLFVVEKPSSSIVPRQLLQCQRTTRRWTVPPFASAALNNSSSSKEDKDVENYNEPQVSTSATIATPTTTTTSMTMGMLLLKRPVALLGIIPKEVSLFLAGAFAGVAAKTITAPLDRIKLLMQTHGIRAVEESAKKSIGFFEAAVLIGKEEGAKGYWKGNLPQVIRIIPYSATQLFAYEVYKKLFKGDANELSVVGRLAAGACAGMTSTLVTYPLDVLRLRLAVEPGCISMSQVAMNMLRDEGIVSFYNGLGPSLLGIAPYIAVNFCIFDLVKKSLPEKYRNRPESSLVTALVSASLATLTCYPLDTVRRQMQMKSTPYKTIISAIPGIIERDGFIGLYRGFVPNALKNLPNSSIRLTTFDAVKDLISAGQKELQRIMEENREKITG